MGSLWSAARILFGPIGLDGMAFGITVVWIMVTGLLQSSWLATPCGPRHRGDSSHTESLCREAIDRILTPRVWTTSQSNARNAQVPLQPHPLKCHLPTSCFQPSPIARLQVAYHYRRTRSATTPLVVARSDLAMAVGNPRCPAASKPGVTLESQCHSAPWR